ncbi:hypothetical protein [Oceanirhabdus sp. W0125-5]|uniref:hypothetical protein n=1 Tax=Oceanirhabdus sp. W0125-5 TaxID=2999116 RepID=UPI0022F3480C|nr:hypothetical protein [Oceanirhabdus sp. W0125-5]WBW96468.1 hypothetical protein OW730_22650 [Oceanirhabdus sp. W0125-5]
MIENGSIEIITFHQVDNVGEHQVFDGLKVLDVFYKRFNGYGGMHIAKGEKDQWTLVLFWDSKELERKASASMMKNDETIQFKMLVNGKTVVKNVYPCFGVNKSL